MQTPKSRPFKRQLFWLAALLILGTGAVVALSLNYQRTLALESGRRMTESLAVVIEEQTTRTVQTVDQRLQLAVSGLAQLEARNGLDEHSARTLLRQHVKELPFVRAMWVLDSAGRIQYDSDVGNIGLSLADRAYFQIYLSQPKTGFHLGKPVRSRSTGAWLISATRPLYDKDGTISGVVVAAVEPPYFDKLWQQIELGEGGSIALLHRDGALMMRSPFADAAMGKNFADTPLFREHLPRSAVGYFQDPSPVDALLRLFAYRALSAYPDLLVIVGQSHTRMLAPWRQLAMLAGLVWLVASALIAVLCWQLGRSWQRRDKADADLQQVGQRLALATDAASIGVWDWDVSTDHWTATPTYYTMLGYTPEVGLGNRQLWFDRLHPQDREAVVAEVQAVLNGSPAAYEYEARILHANGSYRWVSVIGRVLEQDPDGKARRVLGIRTDITERMEAQEQLRLSEENLSITLQSIGDGVIATDTSGRVTRMNAMAERLTGWPLEQALGQPLATVFRIINVQTRELCSNPVDLVMERREPVGMANHTALVARDGVEHQISDSGAPIFDANGSIVGVVLVFSDVTEQYRVRQALADSEERFRTLIEWTPEAIAVHSKGIITYVNPAAVKLFGANSTADLVGHPMLERVHPDFREVVLQRTTAITEVGEPAPMLEEKFLRLDGSVLFLEVQGTRISLAGEPAVQVAMHDITARRTTELALLQSQATQRESALLTRTILDNLMDGVITINTLGLVQSLNQAAAATFGYAPGEVIGRNISMLMPEPYQHQHDGYLQRYRQTGESRAIGKTLEFEGLRKDGVVFPMSLQVSEIVVDGTTTFIGVVRDITQHRRDVEEIRRLAYFDALTNLPNRRLLTDRLRQAMLNSARTGHHGALMFLDLDHFKQLNDTRGHDVGDLLLQEVGARLQASVREGDSVARLGGDEFVVLLESLSTQELEAATQAEGIAHKILAALGEPYVLREASCTSTPSIGIVVFIGDHASIEDLLKKADVAMYQAKSAGRNTARFFDPAMQAAATAYAELEADLRRGLKQREFVVYYQIQVDCAGHTIGAEALVRWCHSQRGLVAPGHFIGLAEETGLILPLGQWVLETACAQLCVWAQSPRTQAWTMAVNVSAAQFTQPRFVDTVAQALAHSGANPCLLKLELTESMLVGDVDDVIAKMNQVKAMGVGFSLDDFGTGYSSLSYLKRLPLDQLKIDQSFVRDIPDDTSDAMIAHTIVALGHSLGLKVIAEGVETQEQLDFLVNMGCDAFQGYYYGRPVPVDQLG